MRGGSFNWLSGWWARWWNTGLSRDRYDEILCRFSKKFRTTENAVFSNGNDFSVTFAPVIKEKRQMMEKKTMVSESLMNIFNSFNEEVQDAQQLHYEAARITNIHFDKNGQDINIQALGGQERTVYSLDEGNRLVFLFQTGCPPDKFIIKMEADGKVVLSSMFSEMDIPHEHYQFIFNKHTGEVMLLVTGVSGLFKDNCLDRKLVLEIHFDSNDGDAIIASQPFIILSGTLKPAVKPTDMFFLEEDDMPSPPSRLVGADPDLQTYLYLNLQANITNDNEWVAVTETEVEIKFYNEQDDLCYNTVSPWIMAEDRSHYYINEQIETCLFNKQTTYRVVASFLGKDIAETRLFIGKDIEARGYEWTDLTVRSQVHNGTSGLESIREMVGLDSIKRELEKTVCYMKLMNARHKAGLPCAGKLMHMVMAGSPGTGKTTVARLMGSVFKEMGFLSKGHLVEANRESLTDCIIGGTEKKTRRMLDMAKGGVLFIDEAYSLKSEESDDRDFGQRVIDTLMTELSNPDGDTLVILAGYSKEMDRLLRSNPGLASRFPVRIDFPDYTPDELMQIARLFFRKNRYNLSEGVEERMMKVFEQAVLQKNFGNGRFVQTFIQNNILPQMGSRLAEQLEQGEYDESLLTEIMPQDIPDAGQVLSSMGLGEQKSKIIGFAR